jgi:TatD DNase family protein
MEFLDIHSHLDMCENISGIISNCNERNIKIVTCGVNPKINKKTLELKEKHKEIEICLGVYPLDGLKLSEKEMHKEISFIRDKRDKIYGIGEVGLDLHHEKSPEKFEIQKDNFGKFVKLAIELDKPVFVHSRDAEEETVEFLEKFGYEKIVMHCFSGNMKLVKRIIKNGWFLSIPASVKYNEHFQKIIEIAPIENLFCETDSPFLHPDRIQGMKNTSENVLESYKKISEIKKLSLEEVKEKIWKNFLSLSKI